MKKNNEKGSTLIVVLLLVVVITILGAALFSMNISATKQFTKKEEQVQARHLAEMGVEHYQKKIDEEVKEFNKEEPVIYYIGTGKDRVVDEKKTREEHTKRLCEKINKVSNFNSESALTTGNYEVEVENINCMNITSETNDITIGLMSKGDANNTKREIGAEVIVVAEGQESSGDADENSGDMPPESSDNQIKYVDGDLYIDKNEPIHESSSLHINGDLKAHPGNNHTHLTVDRDLYIQGDIDVNNHVCLTVYGDFKLFGEIKKINAHFYIVIHGDAYFEFPPSENDIKNKAGIFVKGNVNNNVDHIYTKKPPIDNECKVIDKPVPNPYSNFKWNVKPHLNAEYL